MWLRLPNQTDGDKASSKHQGFSVRRGWSSRQAVPKSPTLSFAMGAPLPPTPTTPRAPPTHHLYPPESPSEFEQLAACSRQVSSASSSSDNHLVTPLASPSISPLTRQTPTLSSSRPPTRLAFYEPSSTSKPLPPLCEPPHPRGMAGDDSPRSAVRTFTKRVATLVRNRSWSMNLMDGGMEDQGQAPRSPSRRAFGRGSSSVRDLQLDDRPPRSPSRLAFGRGSSSVRDLHLDDRPPRSPSRLAFGRGSSSVRDVRLDSSDLPLRLTRPSRELAREHDVKRGIHVPQKSDPIEEEEVATPTSFVSKPLTARMGPSSIKSEAIRPRMPPAEHYLKRTQSQYMSPSKGAAGQSQKNSSQIWSEAMRLQVDYYNRPASPPQSPRRGPAPPPRPHKRVPNSAASVKSLPLQCYATRKPHFAPSVKTISSATSHAESATAMLAEMVAASHAKLSQPAKLAQPTNLSQPSKPMPDMPTSARSSCSFEELERPDVPEVPDLPPSSARAAAEARFKVKRKVVPRNSIKLPRRQAPRDVEASSPSAPATPKRNAHARRGTFGEDELADLAVAQSELLARLGAESSDSCEPRSSYEECYSVASVESGPRPRPWGYV